MAVDLTTRAARKRLAPGISKTVRVGRGLALIYRRGRNGEAGTWRVRKAVPTTVATAGYRFGILGAADDLGEETGLLSFQAAVARAAAWDPKTEASPVAEDAAVEAPYTVADGVGAYLRWFKEHRRSYDQTRLVLEAHVLPALGDLSIELLTAERLREWHEALASSPARLRGRRGDEARKTRPALTEDQRRARRSTANGVLSVLKAALNRAWEDGRVSSREAWQRVKPFKQTTPPPPRWLSDDEVTRLLNAAEPENFRRFIHGALVTGARRGELAGLRVKDYNPDTRVVTVPAGVAKTGKQRGIPLTEEGAELFDELTAGRRREEPIFTLSGKPWGPADHHRLLCAAYEVAGIEDADFYSLRHSFIARLKMAGVSSYVIAEVAGNSPAMVERVYGRITADHVAEQVRAHLPRFGAVDGNLKRMRPKAARVRG